VARDANEAAVRLFGEVARIVLDPTVRDAQLRHAIYRRISAARLQEAADASARIVRPDEDLGLDFLRKRYDHPVVSGIISIESSLAPRASLRHPSVHEAKAPDRGSDA
jgi:hypothetical protein